MKETETLIVGAGAAGLSCALYLSRARVPFILLEKGAPGGKLLTIAEIANYPGLPAVSGVELAQDLLQSAARVGAEPVYGEVQLITREKDAFIVRCADETYSAHALVIASGIANVPTIPGEKERLGRGVSYCATCDGPLYHGKDVALYGTGDRANEEALYLAGVVNKLTYLTPEASLQGSASLLEALQSKANVEIVRSVKMDAVLGEGRVQAIEYELSGVKKTLAVSAFFPLLGEKSAVAFLSPLSPAMEHGFLKVDATMMSSVPGLFAAGDIVDKKLRQVVTAASDGALASQGVVSYLAKRKKGAD
jgi:thioredoxin reductase (NADPH)